IKCGFLVGTSSPPPVASALALVFRELKVLNPSQLFAFSAEKHLDIAKSPGIPGYPKKWDKFMCQVFGFLIPLDRCVYDQNYILSDKVISED
ncbi:hypothetical protein, partial [Bartonella sp. AD328YNZD]|uniref:hypothetical protein n=1 Tax=Bartonella sp. AD328YNZD TaxID=3243464 RepID=UPI0035D040E2